MLHIGTRKVFALLLIAAPVAAQSEVAFDQGMAAVHADMERGKWQDALEGMDTLLRDHRGQVYVQAQCDALVHDYQTCSFYKVARRPKLADLISGKVVSFSERSGKVKLKYSSHFADWQDAGDLLVHPAVFAGPYSITVEGRSYYEGNQTGGVYFDLRPTEEEYFYAEFGLTKEVHGRLSVAVPCSVVARNGARDRGLGDALSPIKSGKKFSITAKVSSKQVDLYYSRKRILRAKREPTTLGQVAIPRRHTRHDVFIEGKVEPSWYQGMVDAHFAGLKAKFDEGFDPKKVLPKWLFERPELKRTPAANDLWLPGSDRGYSEKVTEVMKLWNGGGLRAALAAARKLTDEDVAAVSRAFLEAALLLQLGQPERALEACDKVATEDASCLTLLQRAEVLDQLGRASEAISDRRKALADDPGRIQAYQDLVVALLRAEKADEAARVVRDGKIRHGLWDELGGLDTLLGMVRRGPRFARSYKATSKHYEVISDIDRKVCQQACRLLEASYVSLRVRLGSLKQKDEERFRVFLFSGEGGYQAYCKAILGSAVPHTAGLYSPVLKQLLIWNLPKRDAMERTVRHEGFHQFLDRFMKNPPVWLNEGMAEYWETARREQGSLRGGQVRKDHIATLVRSRKVLPSLRDFVYGGRGDFYANALHRYAQGWAMVHFLREGGRDNEKRFETLWQSLRGEGSAKAALDKAFKGVDWERFEQRFWKHLRNLD